MDRRWSFRVGGAAKLEPMSGIEPPTYGLRNRCSTTELHWLAGRKPGGCPLFKGGNKIRVLTPTESKKWRILHRGAPTRPLKSPLLRPAKKTASCRLYHRCPQHIDFQASAAHTLPLFPLKKTLK